MPELTSGLSTFMDDNSSTSISIQESILVQSMKAIIGTDAARIKSLLLNAAVFGEDQRQ